MPQEHPSPSALAVPAAGPYDVIVTRDGLVEARHRVHAVVVEGNGTVRQAVGDPARRTWWRSCAKPFQVMPLVREGGFEALGWGDEELALACASHGGEPEHVALAARMLGTVGLDERALACGAHEPLAERGARLLREAGAMPTRLHNNCSGKHAAMLARAGRLGAPLAGYHEAGHPVQRDALAEVAHWCDLPEAEVQVGTDGCGVRVFGLPLQAMAVGYARLAEASLCADPVAARILRAMTTHPFLVGGTDRFDTLVMQATGGRVVCKVGAEGVHSAAIIDVGIGLALKVEDGHPRAQYPAMLALLSAHGAFPDGLPPALQEVAAQAVRNTRGERVGTVRVASLGLGDAVADP
ncbi:MAG: asparaginase [Gemmatimonadetes bacterium]|nr:asparaginase [Gemmatimonadota bacterium]